MIRIRWCIFIYFFWWEISLWLCKRMLLLLIFERYTQMTCLGFALKQSSHLSPQKRWRRGLMKQLWKIVDSYWSMGHSLYSLLVYMFENFHTKMLLKREKEQYGEKEQKRKKELDVGIKRTTAWKVALLCLYKPSDL